jgi:hypothetical protein
MQFAYIIDRLARAKDVLATYRVELRTVMKEVGKGTWTEYDGKGKEHKCAPFRRPLRPSRRACARSATFSTASCRCAQAHAPCTLYRLLQSTLPHQRYTRCLRALTLGCSAFQRQYQQAISGLRGSQEGRRDA